MKLPKKTPNVEDGVAFNLTNVHETFKNDEITRWTFQ